MKHINKQPTYRELRPITAYLEDAVYSILFTKFRQYFNSNLMLDSFAGTGRFGFFIFHKCNINNLILVEKNATSCKTIFKRICGKSNIKVVCANFFYFIYNNIFDIVILDPPFKYFIGNKLLSFVTKQTYINSDTLIIMRKSVDDIIDYNEHKNIIVVYEYIHDYNHCIFFKVKKIH